MNLKRISAITLAALMLFTACISAIAGVVSTNQITDVNSAQNALVGEQTGLIMNVGSDETDRHFTWYSTHDTGSLEYALRSGNTFPTEFTTLNSNPTPAGSTYIHRVYISGLKPDSEYVYRIKNGTKVSQNYYFTTDSTVNFNFAFAGDPQIGASYNISRDSTNWGKTVDYVKNNFPETSLFLTAGDQVNNGNNEDQYAGFLAPTYVPTFAIATTVGNHEDGYADSSFDTTYAIYSEHYNLPNRILNNKLYGKTTAGSNYWYTYNNALFIHLNASNVSYAEHDEFIKNAVETNPNVTWKFVILHYALFGSHYFESAEGRRNNLGPIYQKYGIDVVLNGHEHDYVRSQMITFNDSGYTYKDVGSSVTDPTGIFYLTACSSSSSKFYSLAEDSVTPHVAFKDKEKQTITYCEVTANTFKLSTYDVLNDVLLDTFEIKKTKGIATAYDTNVALGKSYTNDALYIPSDATTPKYPDEGGTMTDGKYASVDALYKDAAFMAFNKNYGDYYSQQGYASITVDLGAKYDLQRFVAQVGTAKLSNGIAAPKSLAVYVSNDKSTWTKAGECNISDSSTDSCIPANVSLDKSVNARYVQYRFVAGSSNYIFVAEVEAYTAHTHTEGEMKEVRTATATCDGRIESRCTSCGAVVNYEDIPAFNNDPNNRNRALAKSYTTSGWYIKDGETNEKYPDENGNTMTDGQLAADGDTYGSSVFAGFHKSSTFYTENGYFAISVDLNKTYMLDKFVTEVATSSDVNVGAGVRAPAKVGFYVSEDNVNWTKAGEVIVTDNTTGRATVTLTLDKALSGRYVQYRYVRNENSGFVFVSEVEAHEAMPSQSTVTKTNVAYTKTYTSSGLYPDAATATYPDENGKSLTDGASASSTAKYSDVAFAGFNKQSTEYKSLGYAAITVDLGKAYNLDEFAVKMGTAALGSGIYAPAKIEVYVSDNKTDWKMAATIVPTDLYESSVTTASVQLAPAVNARYVQYRITSNTSWIMIAEVEAYEEVHVHTPADTWSTDKNNHWKECACGEDMNKAAHTAGDWEVKTPATLEKAGEQVKKCTVCKYVLETKEIPQLTPEHTHSAIGGWESDKDNHWKECSCGEDLDKAAHTAGDWVVVTPATTEKAGEQVKKCTVCEYVLETKEIPKLEPEHTHAPADKWSTDKNNHWKECDCGEDLNKAAHTASDWVVVTPATTEKAGEQVKKCTVCEYVLETKEIPKLEEEKPDPTPDTEPEIMLGDVNDSKEIDSMDYVLVKRAYFGTFTFNDDQLKAADVNASGDIDSMDYVLIKRAYFGTFSFQ